MILHFLVPLLNPNLPPSLMMGDAIDRPLTGKLDNKLIRYQEDLAQQQATGVASRAAGPQLQAVRLAHWLREALNSTVELKGWERLTETV